MRKIQRWFLAAGLLSAAAAQAAPFDVEALARTCNNCHGLNGVSSGPPMPSIAGLPEAYLKTVMLQWKKGERFSTSMGRLISGYSEEQIAAVAAYFAKLSWTPVVQKGDAKLIARGQAASERCEVCHGTTGSDPEDPDTPKLNGQWAKYLEFELRKYQDPDTRVKLPHTKMRWNVRKLEAADVKATADFYAAQPK